MTDYVSRTIFRLQAYNIPAQHNQLLLATSLMTTYKRPLTPTLAALRVMGAGTGGAGWASAHPGKNQGGHGPPWKF